VCTLTVCSAKTVTVTVMLCDVMGHNSAHPSAPVVAQDDDEQQVVLLMDRLESNLSTEMRSWSQYDYEILARVLTPIQVVMPGCLPEFREDWRHPSTQIVFVLRLGPPAPIRMWWAIVLSRQDKC